LVQWMRVKSFPPSNRRMIQSTSRPRGVALHFCLRVHIRARPSCCFSSVMFRGYGLALGWDVGYGHFCPGGFLGPDGPFMPALWQGQPVLSPTVQELYGSQLVLALVLDGLNCRPLFTPQSRPTFGLLNFIESDPINRQQKHLVQTARSPIHRVGCVCLGASEPCGLVRWQLRRIIVGFSETTTPIRQAS